jgi:hypothetical protein
MDGIHFNIKGSINQKNGQGDNIVDLKGTISDENKFLYSLLREQTDEKKRKGRKWITYLGIFAVILIGSVIFWLLAILTKEFFDIWITNENIIITLIGVLATFVVVSNYIQVKEVKDEFLAKITSTKSDFEKMINNKMTDYDYTVSGDMNILFGRMSFDKGSTDACSLSFFYYVDALNYIDKASDKRSLDGVFLGIKELSKSKIDIKTTALYKEKAIELLKKYPGGRTLIDYVNSIEIFK